MRTIEELKDLFSAYETACMLHTLSQVGNITNIGECAMPNGITFGEVFALAKSYLMDFVGSSIGGANARPTSGGSVTAHGQTLQCDLCKDAEDAMFRFKVHEAFGDHLPPNTTCGELQERAKDPKIVLAWLFSKAGEREARQALRDDRRSCEV